ncbi:MAG: endolytic transglycosylase MltG [bacterium]|nr:endolytic transglycosylase MltG [bacterium]
MTEVNRRALILVLVIAIALTGITIVIYVPAGKADSPKKEFIVSEGDGSSTVARLLAQEDLVRNRYWFLLYTLLVGKEREFKAGRYLLSPGMNIPKLVSILSEGKGETNDIVITIPEGFNVWEIDRRLAEQGLIKGGEFVKKAQAKEGYLFPDTYRLQGPQDDKPRLATEIVDELFAKMTEHFQDQVGKSPNREQIIVAAMLEKEVQKSEDMALVAGIIERRLALKMLLQIDASVAYGACLQGAGEEVPPRLSRKVFCDASQINLLKWLKIDSPYNTYMRVGLPAGPISNPGERAIQAALNPQQSDYLFYLSAPDGKTIFSKTAEEHERNRVKYLGK